MSVQTLLVFESELLFLIFLLHCQVIQQLVNDRNLIFLLIARLKKKQKEGYLRNVIVLVIISETRRYYYNSKRLSLIRSNTHFQIRKGAYQ